MILNKLKEAQIDYSLLVGSLSHNDDHGTDDTGRTFNMMEDGSETLSREEVAQLAARQEKFIQSLQAALTRIENKTYGIQTKCSQLFLRHFVYQQIIYKQVTIARVNHATNQ